MKLDLLQSDKRGSDEEFFQLIPATTSVEDVAVMDFVLYKHKNGNNQDSRTQRTDRCRMGKYIDNGRDRCEGRSCVRHTTEVEGKKSRTL